MTQPPTWLGSARTRSEFIRSERSLAVFSSACWWVHSWAGVLRTHEIGVLRWVLDYRSDVVGSWKEAKIAKEGWGKGGGVLASTMISCRFRFSWNVCSKKLSQSRTGHRHCFCGKLLMKCAPAPYALLCSYQINQPLTNRSAHASVRYTGGAVTS